MLFRPNILPLFLISLTIVTQSPASGFHQTEPRLTDERTAKTTAVAFDLYHGYMIVARGSVGPLKNLHFFIDTGATPTVLDGQIARKLHLEEDAATSIVILGGRARGGTTLLPSLEFGPVRRSNLQVVTADLSFLQKALPVRIDAIVGLDALGQGSFEIDYTSRTIRFGPAAPMPFSMPLRIEGGFATVEAEVNHEHAHLLLDTGTGSLILFETAGTAPQNDAAARTVGEFESKPTQLRALRLGDAEFGQEPALLVRNPKQTQLNFDGLMAPTALGISRIWIDPPGGVVEFAR